jgi:XTP/dITP diphosphohydrolase
VRLVVATRNEHKLRELAQIMEPWELEPLPEQVELPPETGTTFAQNALGKARAAAAATGLAAIADDSGIEASALQGAPGVWSARYAGEGAGDEQNLAKLLEDVPADGDRRVAYVCAIAYVEPGGRVEVVHGRCEGELAHAPRGQGGFGYDPAFVPDDVPDGRTMAELDPEEKDAISHRGRAARELVRKLVDLEMERRPPPLLAAMFGRHGERGERERRRRERQARLRAPGGRRGARGRRGSGAGDGDGDGNGPGDGDGDGNGDGPGDGEGSTGAP